MKENAHILVIGAQGSGKTTLVNALAGAEVIPTRLPGPGVPGLQVHLAQGPSVGTFAHLRFDQTPPAGALPVGADVLEHLRTQGPVPMMVALDQLPRMMALPRGQKRVQWGQTPVERLCIRTDAKALGGVEYLDVQGFLYQNMDMKKLRAAIEWADKILFVTHVMSPLNPRELNFLRQVVLPMGKKDIALIVNGMDMLPLNQQTQCRVYVHNLAQGLEFHMERFFLSARSCLQGVIQADMERLRERIDALGQSQPEEADAAEQLPAEEIPAEETPAEEIPAEEAPEAPALEIPAQEALAREIPAEEPSAQEPPAQDDAEEALKEQESSLKPPAADALTLEGGLTLPRIEEEEEAQAQLSDDKYFSSANLDNLTGIGEHTQYARELLERYQWPQEVYDGLSRRLDAITARQKDKKLNVSVVGEFSAGKSTFINALLRSDLLDCGSIQGTTVASTIIEYGKSFVVATRNRDGSQTLVKLDSFHQLRECLNRMVTENREAQDLDCVRVTLPSKNLMDSGLRIIDTPGTSATTEWHETVTQRAIHNFSDLSILLVNGTRPLTDSFCRFVQDNLENVLDKCVFVVTKLDLIPAQERAKMLTYIRNKIITAFGVEKPLVLPYFSAEVVGTFSENEFAKGDRKSLQISQKSEQYIRQHTARQRSLVQTGKMLELIDGMYEAVQRQIQAISQEWEQELQMLERSSHVDLQSFVDEQTPQRLESFTATANDIGQQLAAAMNFRVQQAIGTVLMKARSYSANALEGYLRTGLAADCTAQAQSIHALVGEFDPQVQSAMTKELEVFQKEFAGLYDSLRILSIDMSQVEMPSMAPKQMSMAELEDGLQSLTQELTYGKSKLWGSVDKTRARVTLDRLGEVLRNYFNRVRRDTMEEFTRYSNMTRVGLKGNLEQYVIAYRDQVALRIAREDERKREIEEKLSRLQMDVDDINNRKFLLDSVRESLRST
ncbi:MAG: dynamin family protein [Oscillospiraceae bacterium]|nr:dynamin family protein [Oscillospiraceae bacterium]